MTYPDTMTVEEARKAFFWDTGFGEPTYAERWSKTEWGVLPILIPNTARRRRALRIHDLHHVLTGRLRGDHT
jgi:hypothetical protein